MPAGLRRCRPSRSPKTYSRNALVEESMVTTHVSRALGSLCVALLIATPTASMGQQTTKGPNALDALVGAWRLVSLERTGPAGVVEKPDCTGQFLFTAEG